MNAFLSALRLTVASTLLLGFVWPLLVTGLCVVLAPDAAAGGAVTRDGVVIGVSNVGQPFTGTRYLWGRPAANGYDGKASSGSNFGPLHPDLAAAVAERATALRAAHPDAAAPIPSDLLTASGSGLDPHVSLDAARWQVGRIAAARGVAPAAVQSVIDAHTTRPLFGVFGEAVVNVLAVNLALDAAHP